MKKWLFNPFIYVAGSQALFLGWLCIFITVFVSYFSNTRFDGILDMHLVSGTLATQFKEQFIDWAVLVIVFFIAGKTFSRSSIRLIDVAGTIAMARWVLLLAALAGFGVDINVINKMSKLPPQEMVQLIDARLIITSSTQLLMLVWMIALLYNAICVSCNLKGGKATAIFIVGLAMAEIITKIIFHYL